MTLDRKTAILFYNDHTGEILQAGTLDQYIAPDAIILRNPWRSTIKSIMLDPDKFGKSLMYDIASDYKEHSYAVKISYICLYIAVCCFMNKTEICKSLIDNLVNAYWVAIDGKWYFANDVKYILKEIVTGMLDKHSDTFEAMARKCGKELSV